MQVLVIKSDTFFHLDLQTSPSSVRKTNHCTS